MFHVLIAMIAQVAVAQGPISNVCSKEQICRPVVTFPDTADQIDARKQRFMAAESRVFAPFAAGRNASTCATAMARSLAESYPSLTSVIRKLCQAK